jgi:hypothetical protein
MAYRCKHENWVSENLGVGCPHCAAETADRLRLLEAVATAARALADSQFMCTCQAMPGWRDCPVCVAEQRLHAALAALDKEGA